jgi:pyruvate/2-oxoglutarate/acetoin dehydrogenase E1 component
MNKPQYSPYKDALSNAMKELGKLDNTIFIGQQIIYAGNPMSTTLTEVPKEKMIEVPVMEETQMGMSLGLAMTGKSVITFYPRWDFLICATNQLINHIDKYQLMTNKLPHIIIRLGKGSDKPLDPGHQHKGNYFEEFKLMCPNIEFLDLKTPLDIKNGYDYVTNNIGIYILVEYPELYYEN